MFVDHDDVNSNIEEDAKLWRYMDFAKLVSLLSNESLYLCRSDKFRDVFEGRLFGLENVKKVFENQNLRMNNRYLSEEDDDLGGCKSLVLGGYDEYSKVKLETAEFIRKNMFVNCWHLNEEQSAAMWDLYVKSGEGIAVQTTFGRVKRSLDCCGKDIYIGKVEYIDHLKEENYIGDKILPFFTKRLSFKHEEEVRVIYSAVDEKGFWDDATKYEDMHGINLKVDLNKLIESIYISPDAPSWFASVVEVILEKFNIDAKVIHSKLYELN
ncbi:DUF2971 domain-containing protein [Bacillus thuringiensis]|uniref:DUF2971 domain-containing protein n=1 Tax=Bacillus thuringiensis TaxID=1428 RepID=UPI0018774A66|nr:DUF2971 domain-containing protein [Bacillus thuringiensis]MBE5091945.1 DUF2971 domain-containing protein [Bacillus thuringiensis]